MTDEITRKLPTIKRRVRVEELEVYIELQHLAQRSGVLGDSICEALTKLVEKAGEVRVRVNAS